MPFKWDLVGFTLPLVQCQGTIRPLFLHLSHKGEQKQPDLERARMG